MGFGAFCEGSNCEKILEFFGRFSGEEDVVVAHGGYLVTYTDILHQAFLLCVPHA